MKLTGTILFFGFIVLFIFWSKKFYFFIKHKTILQMGYNKKEKDIEIAQHYAVGVSIFIIISIAAGMAWD